MAVVTEVFLRTRPDFLQSVSYPGNLLRGQNSLIPKDCSSIVRSGCDCQHQGGRELGESWMMSEVLKGKVALVAGATRGALFPEELLGARRRRAARAAASLSNWALPAQPCTSLVAPRAHNAPS